MPENNYDVQPLADPEIDVTEAEGMTAVQEIRSVQLNEKISDTHYQILHPETDANQVITDPERRFVSDADKAKWDSGYDLALNALHYKGEYVAGTTYEKYDVVYLVSPAANTAGDRPLSTANNYPNITNTPRRYFININNANTASPNYDLAADKGWVNFNYESFLAEYAREVLVEKAEGDTLPFKLGVWNTSDDAGAFGNGLYADDITFDLKNNTIKFFNDEQAVTIELNGKSGEVSAKKFIGDLEGIAQYAERYIKYQRQDDGSLSDGVRQPIVEEANYIEDQFIHLQKQIDDLTGGSGGEGGGAILKNKLTVQKNETTLVEFDGSEAKTANITFKTEEISDLLDGSKIDTKWLPDSILGQLEYKGTWNPSSSVGVVSEPQHGWYYIAIGNNGAFHPNGSAMAAGQLYEVGDWAVYTVEGGVGRWEKIDNTDAVRTVNDQIGDVKTYKGNWNASTKYYAGDMVEGTDGAVYVCINNHTSTTDFAADSAVGKQWWKICGRIYKADHGIILNPTDNVTFEHDWREASYTATTLSTTELEPGVTQEVSYVTIHDKYGHVEKEESTKLATTWRPVQVDGNDFIAKNANVTLNLTDAGANDNRIDVQTGSAGTVIFQHKNNAKNTAGSVTSGLTDTNASNHHTLGFGSKFKAPNLTWNISGHIDDWSDTTFELPSSLIQHKHFNVAIDENKNALIRAFSLSEYNALQTDTGLKFVATNTLIQPTSNWDTITLTGAFNASEFKQIGKTKTNGQFALERVIDESAALYSGTKLDGQNIVASFNKSENRFELGNSGILGATAGATDKAVFSAVAVNREGIAVAGGQIVEFGTYNTATNTSSEPSQSLVIGGLFFRNLGPNHKVTDIPANA